MPTCKNCSNDFHAKRSDAAYCSDACRKADKRKGVSPDKAPVIADTDSADVSEVISPNILWAKANELVKLQRDHRGYSINSQGERILAPYKPTPETEARAAQIIDLRKRAARLQFPLAA